MVMPRRLGWTLVVVLACIAGCSQVLGLDGYAPAPTRDAGDDQGDADGGTVDARPPG
jgi:hypothetical protein